MIVDLSAATSRREYWLALLVACAIPGALHAQLPPAYGIGLGGIGLLGLVPRLAVAPVIAAGTAAFLAAGAAPALDLHALFGLGVVLIVMLRSFRWEAVAAGALVSLTVVAALLSAADHPATSLLLRAAGGLLIGSLAAAATHGLCRGAARWHRPAAVGAALLSALLLLPAWSPGPGLPGFATARAELAAVNSLEALAADRAAGAALERLRIAGVADAAWLSVVLGVAQNDTPARLRETCPAHDRGRLAARWQREVEEGRLLCSALEALPEEGAGLLAAASVSGAARLRGDLLLEAGLLDQAVEVLVASGEGGARRNAVRALVDRNRSAQAMALAEPTDPLTALWLDPAGDDPARWAAWNRALDLGSRQHPSRAGVQPVDAPGDLLSIIDPTLGQRVLVTRTRYTTRFALALPLPPGRRVPGVVSLTVRNRRGLELALALESGERLTYTCDPFSPRPQETVLALPAAVCNGEWGVVLLAPRGPLADRALAALELRGDFALAAVEILPP